MANDRTLTAANAVIMLGVTGLFDTPRRLQGFAADNVATIDPVTNTETSMGIDGRLSAGFIHNPIQQSITLQADSESVDMFEFWHASQKQRRETYWAFGSILLRATGKRYTMTRGVMTAASLMPAINRTLQPRQFTLVWQDVTVGPA